MKRLLAMQKLLYNTEQFNSFKDVVPPLIIALAFLYSSTVFGLSSYTHSPFAVAFATVYWINQIQNSDRYLHEIVPVSNKFAVLNIYLYAIIATLSLTALLYLISLSINLAISEINRLFTAPGADIQFSVQMLANSWHGNLFIIFTLMIITIVGTTIGFIRNKAYRRAGFTALVLALAIFLITLNRSIPDENLLNNLAFHPQVNTILIALGIATLLIIPGSIILGLKLFRQRALA